jgi:hypothetical protein
MRLDDIGSLDEAVMLLALLLNGDADHDGEMILDFCETFYVPPHAVYREIFSRCVLPTTPTVH